MFRLFLITVILLMNLIPTPAEEQVKEAVKLKGQVEYDDNPVETIYLDEDVEKPEVNIPQHSLTLPVGVLNIISNTNTERSALARAMVNRRSLGDILPLSAVASVQSGGISYGTIWGEELSHSQMEETTRFFIRYDSPRRYSLQTSIGQSSNRDMDYQYNTLKITPEWHITDRLTFKDTYSNYNNGQKEKNELTLVYTPALKKYADSLKFELSIAQSYYASGKQSNAMSFATGFKI